ncbi:MAG: DUF4831 family protein [Bacteroidales bacterium]|nr:DUF4831 family protein [Bacteroidales bacterium]MBN2750142.1 DUF4831 family protein [Bacteroidales bacterium]
MRQLFFLVIPAVVLVSCSQKPITVTPASNVTTLGESGFVYTLPRTVLNIEVLSLQKQVTAGPYAAYAQKYLGIAGVPQQSSATWQIERIAVSSSVEPDPQMYFVVENGSITSANFGKLMSSGLVLFPYADNAKHISKGQNIFRNEGNPFADMSVEPFIASEKTTYYSKVAKDSGFVRVPVHKDIIVEKGLEEKARQAADFIFSLRKKRVELLSGDFELTLDGDGFKATLDEIARLEQAYLNLFLGVEHYKEQVSTFEYVPNGAEESAILFRLSQQKGVVAASDLSGSPFVVEIKPFPSDLRVEIPAVSKKQKANEAQSLYYRIPNYASVTIGDGRTDMFIGRFKVYQANKLIRFVSHGAGTK